MLNHTGDDLSLLDALNNHATHLKKLGIKVRQNGAFESGNMDAGIANIEARCKELGVTLDIQIMQR